MIKAFTEEKILMVNKHMKQCLALLITILYTFNWKTSEIMQNIGFVNIDHKDFLKIDG